MNVTLIVATYNGSETLFKSIQSLNDIDTNHVKFNLIFIDNDSSDNTIEILQAFNWKHNFTLLKQLKRGKNAALNTIFDHPEILGDILIFSDDDVIFPKNFITKYASFIDAYPSISVFGGRIDAHWPKVPNEALLAGIDAVVAFAITPTARGYQTGLITPEKLHGPNMAIKKEIFLAGVRFNEAIGPNGGNYVMGSESELLLRLKQMGLQAAYDHENPVEHMIMPYQLTPAWLKSRAFKAGRSMMMHQSHAGVFKPVPEVFGYPRWALMLSLKSRLTALLTPKSKTTYYKALWQAAHLQGYCHEYKKELKK